MVSGILPSRELDQIRLAAYSRLRDELAQMAQTAPDSSSLQSSGTEEDLKEARRRLLAEDDHHYTPGSLRPSHYGSVPPLLPVSADTYPSSRRKSTRKRYRLPFLILLVFDWGLVVFLSIICSEVSDTDCDCWDQLLLWSSVTLLTPNKISLPKFQS